MPIILQKHHKGRTRGGVFPVKQRRRAVRVCVCVRASVWRWRCRVAREWRRKDYPQHPPSSVRECEYPSFNCNYKRGNYNTSNKGIEVGSGTFWGDREFVAVAENISFIVKVFFKGGRKWCGLLFFFFLYIFLTFMVLLVIFFIFL